MRAELIAQLAAIFIARRQAKADVLIVGHTHQPFYRKLRDGRVVANPGALLRAPADPEAVSCPGLFGVLELPSRIFTVHRALDGAAIGLSD